MKSVRSLAAVAAVLYATLAGAQTNKGGIAGTVTDKSGAVVPGATVVITSLATLYLPPERQRAFIAALGELAAHRPVYWVSHEEFATVLGHLLPGRDDLRRGKDEPSFGIVGIVRWENGQPIGTAVAKTAWHGQRMAWLAS